MHGVCACQSGSTHRHMLVPIPPGGVCMGTDDVWVLLVFAWVLLVFAWVLLVNICVYLYQPIPAATLMHHPSCTPHTPPLMHHTSYVSNACSADSSNIEDMSGMSVPINTALENTPASTPASCRVCTSALCIRSPKSGESGCGCRHWGEHAGVTDVPYKVSQTCHTRCQRVIHGAHEILIRSNSSYQTSTLSKQVMHPCLHGMVACGWISIPHRARGTRHTGRLLDHVLCTALVQLCSLNIANTCC